MACLISGILIPSHGKQQINTTCRVDKLAIGIKFLLHNPMDWQNLWQRGGRLTVFCYFMSFFEIIPANDKHFPFRNPCVGRPWVATISGLFILMKKEVPVVFLQELFHAFSGGKKRENLVAVVLNIRFSQKVHPRRLSRSHDHLNSVAPTG